MPDIDPKKAGARLREAIQEAYGKPGRVRNQTQLSEKSGVSRSVLDGWWRGTTPQTTGIQKVADALGVPAESLWLRWLGYEPPEPGLTLIAKEIRALRQTIKNAGGGAEQFQDAIDAVDAAREGLPEEPAIVPPVEPAASSRRRRPAS